MSAIGAPTSMYYKSEELSKLAMSNESLLSMGNLSQQNDYYYNYVTLGLVSLRSYLFPKCSFITMRNMNFQGYFIQFGDKQSGQVCFTLQFSMSLQFQQLFYVQLRNTCSHTGHKSNVFSHTSYNSNNLTKNLINIKTKLKYSKLFILQNEASKVTRDVESEIATSHFASFVDYELGEPVRAHIFLSIR